MAFVTEKWGPRQELKREMGWPEADLELCLWHSFGAARSLIQAPWAMGWTWGSKRSHRVIHDPATEEARGVYR